jgi:diguanylate cyclase (GGDEF)-like protein
LDYGTYYFTNIATVTVFTVCMSLLAWYNRRVKGMSWFAGGIIAGLLKLIFQGLEGKLPPVCSGMLGNELYLISFLMQFLGLHWFVLRKPVRLRWPLILVGILLATYTVMYLEKVPYGGNLVNIPFVMVCGASAWMLFQHGHRPFVVVSRVTAIVLCVEMCVAGFRAVLTNQHYMRPWETVSARSDLYWMYSLALMSFLATFMVMCDLWFLVTELNWELVQQARTDSLTGALNRRAMEEMHWIGAALDKPYDHSLCMMMIDIDHFKQLNDTRGHAAGDCALQAFTRQVKTMLRSQDLLVRTGGDEFTILLPDTPFADGLKAAERVRQAIDTLEIPFETGVIRLTVSVGIAQFDLNKGGWEGMVRRSDAALYEAKQLGRNRVASCMPESS